MLARDMLAAAGAALHQDGCVQQGQEEGASSDLHSRHHQRADHAVLHEPHALAPALAGGRVVASAPRQLGSQGLPVW